MTKSWAEYKREARKRDKARAQAEERTLNTSVFQKSFSEFMAERRIPNYGAHYLALGHTWWDFTQDSPIEPLDDQALDDDEKNAAFNSLGKADLVLSVLEDVVNSLADNIAEYKRSEIDARIAEISKADLVGPSAKSALDRLEHYKRMCHNMNKRVRRSLPQTRAAG